MLVTFAIVFGAAAGSALRCRRLVAAASGLAGGLLALAFGATPILPVLLLGVPVAAVLVEIDLVSLRLPDEWVGALGAIVGLPLSLFCTGVCRSLASGVVLGLAYLAIALLPRGGLGLGDVKLAAVLGYLLGFAGWPTVLAGAILPHLIMGPIALIMLLTRRADRRTDLPFGPALLAGALIAVLMWAL